MKKEIISLSVAIKKERGKGEQFQFNETMIHAILSGLSVVYDEVFIWSSKNRLGVWVVGNSSDFLVQAFLHHRNQFKSIEILEGRDSIQLLNEIALGTKWNEIGVLSKLGSLYRAHALSSELNSLGVNLQPLVVEALSILSENPSVTGSRNSWVSTSAEKQSSTMSKNIVQIAFPDLFYRFSIN